MPKTSPGRVSKQTSGPKPKNEAEGSAFSAQSNGPDNIEFPEPSKMTAPLKKDWSKQRKVKVYRMDQNRDEPIRLCVNDRKNRKVFWPGQEVVLTESEIQALKDSVEPKRIEIPEDSEIYQQADPRLAAMQRNPGWDAEYDLLQGVVYLTSTSPLFVIQEV